MASVLSELLTDLYPANIFRPEILSENSSTINDDEQCVGRLTDELEPSSYMIYGNGKRLFRRRK
jgi:hypothetical protein